MICLKYNSPELDDSDFDGKLVQFVNCRVLREVEFENEHVWVKNGRIVDERDVFFEQRLEADIQIDCCGLILSPGFIDLQLNGGFGIDFSTFTGNYKSGVSFVAKKLLSHGVTSFAPTVITSAPEVYHKVLPLLAKSNGSQNGAGIVGAHLEGPFISVEKRGCHPRNFVISGFGENPVETIERTYSSLENIAIVTLAPELPRADKAIDFLTNRGVTVSVGHSSANLEDGENAAKHGAKMITHLFNAMQPYHHRDPGLIGLLTSDKLKREIFYGIISDGIHTHDSALRIAHRTNPDGMILVTDAIAALGMKDGIHMLGTQTIVVNGLRAILQGTSTTAGSVASMPLCIRHLIKTTGCSIEHALRCATLKPAKLIGISHEKGTLEVGTLADIVLINENIEVAATFCSGKRVFLCA